MARVLQKSKHCTVELILFIEIHADFLLVHGLMGIDLMVAFYLQQSHDKF